MSDDGSMVWEEKKFILNIEMSKNKGFFICNQIKFFDW